MFVCFLKKKSDAAKATAKFIADIAPYGKTPRLRSDNGTEYSCDYFFKLIDCMRINCNSYYEFYAK